MSRWPRASSWLTFAARSLQFAHIRFEPSGQTNDADIRVAKSIVDYVFRWIGKRFLNVDQQEEIGIVSPEVRARLAAGYADGDTVDPSASPAAPVAAAPPGQTALFNAWEDAVECSRCGGRMVARAAATCAATARGSSSSTSSRVRVHAGRDAARAGRALVRVNGLRLANEHGRP